MRLQKQIKTENSSFTRDEELLDLGQVKVFSNRKLVLNFSDKYICYFYRIFLILSKQNTFICFEKGFLLSVKF